MPCISAAWPARAVQLQYDFHSQKLLSHLANHIAITLHKAESAVLKTPSILLLPLLMLLLLPLILLLITQLLLRERGLTLRADHQRIRQPLCWGGGRIRIRAGRISGGRLATSWRCYRLYNCA